MAIATRPWIVAMLLLLVGAPPLHDFLHSGDDGAKSGEVTHQSYNDIATDRHAFASLSETSVQIDAIHTGVSSTPQHTAEQSLPTHASTSRRSSLDTAVMEVGPPVNADAPAEWLQEEYASEINIGEYFSADAPVDHEFSVPEEPINVEKERSERHSGLIEIGPEIEVEPYR